MTQALKFYVRSLNLSLKARRQYPWDFAVGFINSLMKQAALLISIYALLSQFHQLGGWSFPALLFLFSLRMVCHGLYAFFGSPLRDLPSIVDRGDFDRFMLRPVSPLLQVIGAANIAAAYDFLVGVGMLIFSWKLVNISISVANLFVLLLTLVGATLILFAIELISASMAFWLIKTGNLPWILFWFEEKYIIYPMNIYVRPLQAIMTFFLPFAFINFYPAAWLLHQTTRGAFLPAQAGLFVLPVGVVCITIAFQIWKAGLRRYRSTGS